MHQFPLPISSGTRKLAPSQKVLEEWSILRIAPEILISCSHVLSFQKSKETKNELYMDFFCSDITALYRKSSKSFRGSCGWYIILHPANHILQIKHSSFLATLSMLIRQVLGRITFHRSTSSDGHSYVPTCPVHGGKPSAFPSCFFDKEQINSDSLIPRIVARLQRVSSRIRGLFLLQSTTQVWNQPEITFSIWWQLKKKTELDVI